jgi:hypothetical protein
MPAGRLLEGAAGAREYLDRFWSHALAVFERAAKAEEEE